MNLWYKPIHRISSGRFAVLIGDQVLSVSCQKPYPGWNEFKKFISTVLVLVKETGFYGEIERYAIKYINMIPGNVENAMKLQLSLNDLSLDVPMIRAEHKNGDFLTILTLAPNANVEVSGSRQEGTLLDIDTIATKIEKDLFENHDELLDGIRNEEKRIFFDIITDEALESFKPVYQ